MEVIILYIEDNNSCNIKGIAFKITSIECKFDLFNRVVKRKIIDLIVGLYAVVIFT
jgi:hypothetical protein